MRSNFLHKLNDLYNLQPEFIRIFLIIKLRDFDVIESRERQKKKAIKSFILIFCTYSSKFKRNMGKIRDSYGYSCVVYVIFKRRVLRGIQTHIKPTTRVDKDWNDKHQRQKELLFSVISFSHRHKSYNHLLQQEKTEPHESSVQ